MIEKIISLIVSPIIVGSIVGIVVKLFSRWLDKKDDNQLK